MIGRRAARDRGAPRVARGSHRRGRLARAVVIAAVVAATLVVGGGAASTDATRDAMSAWSSPAAITAGPDGNLWFTEFDGNRIGRMTPAGAFTEFAPDPAGEGSMGRAPSASPRAPTATCGSPTRSVTASGG